MEKNERLDRQIDFCREIDKEKLIGRQTYLSDASRKENDSEHAWHMAIMAYLLKEYANEDIDIAKTMIMLLTHDLVEIYAGDTYAYDEKGKESQNAREHAAADRLYGMLPKDQMEELRAIWDEFEAEETAEAKFARTLDNFQPVMLNDASGGLSWRENKIRLSQVLRRNVNTHKGSEELWQYEHDNMIMKNVDAGNLINDIDN